MKTLIIKFAIIISMVLSITSCSKPIPKPIYKGTLYCMIGDSVLRNSAYSLYMITEDKNDSIKLTRCNVDTTSYDEYAISKNNFVYVTKDETKLFDFKSGKNKKLFTYPVERIQISPSGTKFAYFMKDVASSDNFKNHLNRLIASNINLYVANSDGKFVKIKTCDYADYSPWNPYSGLPVFGDISFRWIGDNKLIVAYHKGELPKKLEYNIPSNSIAIVSIDDSLKFIWQDLDILPINAPFKIIGANDSSFEISLYKWMPNLPIARYSKFDTTILACNIIEETKKIITRKLSESSALSNYKRIEKEELIHDKYEHSDAIRDIISNPSNEMFLILVTDSLVSNPSTGAFKRNESCSLILYDRKNKCESCLLSNLMLFNYIEESEYNRDNFMTLLLWNN